MTLPRRIEGIIFDVDGTMYNQRRLRITAARNLASECLRNPRSGVRSIRFLLAYRQAQEQLRREKFAMDISARQIEIACKRTGLTEKAGCDIIEHWFNTAPLKRLHRARRPGLAEFLETARAHGMRLGVFSDYPAETKLAAMRLREYFDVVLSSSDSQVRRLKPDAAGLRVCMARLGVEPEHTLYVGDRMDVDVECAYRAGVCPVILGSHARSSRRFILADGFEDLSRMLFDVAAKS